MPDGQTHARIHTMGWVVVAPTSFYLLVHTPVVAAGVVVGYLSGLILDPDLDQEGLTVAEGRVMKLGIFAWPWLAWWMGYAMVMRHRSFASHFPVISTAIRVGWLLLPILYLIYHNRPESLPGVLDTLSSPFFTSAFWGLSFADLLHFLADMLFGDNKKPRRRGRGRYS